MLVFFAIKADLTAKGDSLHSGQWQVGLTAMAQPKWVREHSAEWKLCGRGTEKPELELDAREIYPAGVSTKNGAV
ncbi:hypothetical protein GCM10011520_14010 [Shewanella carassii]|uniref:Uncharacterized protein n=1 Tax=Shewanella carassii TaxID=1987584 RepID=A0ABQ1T1F4_9GAMM|nr:hypothetical protein GCM10011520_14010 [Shewanella carassii]